MSTSSMQQFTHEQFGQVRTVMQNDEPWFVAKDVCDVLAFRDTNDGTKYLDEDEIATCPDNSSGQVRHIKIINESGLYSLVLRSRKPEAKRFKKWVTSEVLPTIRKHGMYATAPTIERMLEDPDSMITILQTLKQEREQRKLAERQKAAAHATIEEQRPKVLFAESVQVTNDTILIGDLAKLILQSTGYKIGQNRLFEWLRDNGYLHKQGSSYNMPTQRSMDLKIFVVKEGTRQSADGTTKLTRTTKVTGKGQTYFVNKFVGIQSEEQPLLQ